MFDINDTDYYLVTEYLEVQLWKAKERNDLIAIHKIEAVLAAYDSVIDLLKGREENAG